jgi:hypothetical protein
MSEIYWPEMRFTMKTAESILCGVERGLGMNGMVTGGAIACEMLIIALRVLVSIACRRQVVMDRSSE